MWLRAIFVFGTTLFFSTQTGIAQIVGAAPDGHSYGRAQWILNNVGPRDSSGLGARNYAVGPAGAEELLQHNIDRSQSNMQIIRGYERIRLLREQRELVAIRALFDGRAKPVTGYTPVDVSDILARRATQATPERLAEAQTYFRQRETEFHAGTRSAQLPANDLASSCTYLVDALYRVGSGIAPAPHQRDMFRATCIVDMTKHEALNGPSTPQARAQFGEAYGTIGAALLWEAPLEPGAMAQQAQLIFKQLFGQPLGAVPADAFICTAGLHPEAQNCPLIQQNITARLPIILGTSANH